MSKSIEQILELSDELEEQERHIKEADFEIKRLKNQLQQKENIIKEVREYIKEHSTTINFKTMRADYNLNMNELLEILDKENK